MAHTTLLIDGNALMHRAYHAVKFNPTYKDQPFGMVYGFTSGVLYAIEHFAPQHCIVAFDTKEKTFRHKMDDNYKAQRSKAPDDFYPQLPFLDEMLETFGVSVQRKPGYEADDIIGTLALQSAEQNFNTYIMSHDMDYSQLVNDRIKLCRAAGRIQPESIMDHDGVVSKLGIPPSQVVDYKAIVGDSSDNFKGIPGIGPKGAIELLQQFGDLESMMNNMDAIPDKYKAKFEGQIDAVHHCQKLAQIEIAVPVDQNITSTDIFTPNYQDLASLCDKWNFRGIVTRVQKMSSSTDNPLGFDQNKSSKKDEPEDQMSLF